MTSRSFTRSLLALSFGALLLTGCGGSSGSDTTSGSAETDALAAETEALAAEPQAVGTEAATPSGDGPDGVDVSQAPICKLVSAETAKALFGDLKIDTPAPDPRSCGLFAKPEGAAFGASLLIQPMLVPLDSTVSTSKEMGLTIEELSGIGDKAVLISGKVEGFAPKTQLIFQKGEVSYVVAASFNDGVPEVDPATLKGLIVPIAEQYAAIVE